jgi:hypothetical protein
MPEEYYDRDFPNLKKLGFRRTSDPAYYNCLAYAVGDLQRRWWPGEYHPFWSDDYWPAGAPNEETLAAFILALATVQYVPCPDGIREEGVEKIAIYALENGIIKHVALQQVDGTWRSKLGPHEDIEHTLEGLAGPCYGKVAAYLKRPRKPAAQAMSQTPPLTPGPG